MSRWGTGYLEPAKPLRNLSSHEQSRHEYYAQPQDMADYRDPFDDPKTNEKGRSKGGDGVVELWVFRVVHLTDITLESFIKRQGIDVLQMQEVSSRESAYRSFRITVHEKDAPTLLHKTFWPGLVSCKYWNEQAEISKGAALSRRSSAKGHRKNSAHDRGRGVEHASDKKKPPQMLPPLKKNQPNSKESKGQRKPNSNVKAETAKNSKSSNKQPKTTSRAVISSKVARTREDEDRHRKHLNKNTSRNSEKYNSDPKKYERSKTGKNNNSYDKGKPSSKDISKGKVSSKDTTKGKMSSKDRENARKAFVDEFNSWKESRGKESNRETAKQKNKSKGNSKGERNNAGKEMVKVRDTSKQRQSKGSGYLGKRSDNDDSNTNSKQKKDSGNVYDNRRRNDRDYGKGEKQKNTRNNAEQENHKDSKYNRTGSNGKSQKESYNKNNYRESVPHDYHKKGSSEETDQDLDTRHIGKKDRSPRHRRMEGTPYGRGYLYSHETEKDSSREGYLLPEIPAKTPTPRAQDITLGRRTRYTSALPSIGASRNQSKANNTGKTSKNYPNWVLPLSGLLILSSEDAVYALLGTEFDGLLMQDIISDDELFLGVKALAHASRAKMSEQHLMTLVYKIWQPHVIELIKTFTVTVERLYPDRAERYFWDVAEFLDLYVSRNIVIEHMATLVDTCLMEVLALNYKGFLDDDIVKVFRVMQNRVQERLRQHMK